VDVGGRRRALLGPSYTPAVARRTVFFSAPRHREFPVPPREAIIVAEAPYRRRTYQGGEVRFSSLGVVHLTVPWDAQTFAGVAFGALLGGMGAGMAPALGKALEAVGEATGREVIENITIPERMRKSLTTRGAFVVAQVCVVEAAITEGRVTRQLHVVEERDDGGRVEHLANIDFDRIPLQEAAQAIAVQRGFAEGLAALKLAANVLLDVASAGGDRLDPSLPFSDTMVRFLEEAGVAMAEVTALARDRYLPLAADFASCPPAYETFTGMLGGLPD